MVASTRKKAPRPAEDEAELEQKELPGLESLKDPKIRNLARKYKAAQRERMSALDIEVELKDKLIDAMKEKQLDTYKDKDIIVTLSHKDTVKVKSPSDDEGNDEEGAG